jgi:signal transduction histidine kinase
MSVPSHDLIRWTDGGTDMPVLTRRPRHVGNPILLAGAATCLAAITWLVASRLEPAGSWRELLVEHVAYWYTCALFTPVIWWSSQRVVLENFRLGRGLVVQVSAPACFVVVHATALESVRWLADMTGTGAGLPWNGLRGSIATHAALDLVTYGALVAVSYAVIFHDLAEERGRRAARAGAQLVEAQLQALQQRLHPHLLFNALHAISALMHRDVALADRTLGDLGELLRLALDQAGHQQVPLAAELQFLRTYLRIEETRFGDRLIVRFDVQPGALDGLVPTLLLQPLVENAIKHGVARRPGEGHIDVTARRTGGKLRLEVRDDGGGLSEDAYTALQKGTGVSTTRARLQHLYGPDFGFEFHTQPHGLAVVVMVPWRTRRASQDEGNDDQSSENADRGRRAAGA